MVIKILQLNINADNFWNTLVNFLKTSDFDILSLQEVAGPHTYHGNVHCEIDCFRKLQSALGENYSSEFAVHDTFTSDPVNSFEGNAIFYKNIYNLVKKEIFWLNKPDKPFPSNAITFENVGRNVLSIVLEKDAKTFEIINTHLAWAVNNEEHPHQREQNIKFINYIKNQIPPFILTGDFNISPEQPSIIELEKYARSLVKEYKVKNTIDPVNHKSWERIKPGFSVDYIFVSLGIKVLDFKVLDNLHLSDHSGLSATLEI